MSQNPLRSSLLWLSFAVLPTAALLAGSAGAQIVSVYHTDDPMGVPSDTTRPGCAGVSRLLGSTGDSLVEIDPLTGASSSVALIGNNGNVADIDFRASDGVLVGTTGGEDGDVVTIPYESCTGGVGCSVEVFNPLGVGNISALEFVGDTLYGSVQQFGEGGPETYLVTIDLTAQTVATVAPILAGGINVGRPVGGLAFDVCSQKMYGVLGGPLTTGEESGEESGTLLQINLVNGSATVLGVLDPGDLGVSRSVASLEPGPPGLLYAGTGGADPQPGTFFTVDPTTTPPTVVEIGNINQDGAPLSGISQRLSCALQGNANESLELWIDGGDTASNAPVQGQDGFVVCQMGPDGGNGEELCGGDVLVQLVGQGVFTFFDPYEAMADSMIHSISADRKSLHMVFRRGETAPGVGPRKLGTLDVDTSGATTQAPACVNVSGVNAAGANLQLRTIVTGTIAQTEQLPEPGELWLLLSGSLAVSGLARRRARGRDRR